MGYTTNFTLSVTTRTGAALTAELVQDVIDDLRNNHLEARDNLADDGTSQDESKWYKHEEEMKEFSVKHPIFLFTLYGEGEETGDVWKKYFVNGQMQHEKASMQIKPFDPKKLK